MSSYSDDYKDQRQAEFIRRWAPAEIPETTTENLRWNIARARAAEAELKELRDALKCLKILMNRDWR
jgi:hypothetical protein